MRVLVDTPILPMVILSGVPESAHVYDFQHQFDGGRCDSCVVRGVGLRLADNVDRMPETAPQLTSALEHIQTFGDAWWELRKTMGEDALIRWRVGPGKDVEALIMACQCFDWMPDPTWVTSLQTARMWTALLATNLGGFPPVVSAREALVVSEPFDALATFADWRVLTFSTAADPINLSDAEQVDSYGIAAGATLRDVVGKAAAARAHFVWVNSD